MRFRFDPLSRAFSNLCVYNENAHIISLDGRPKRIEVYAFSNARAPNEKRRKSEMERFSFPSLISGLPRDLAFTHDRFAGRSKWRACSLASVYSRHVFGAS